MAILKKNVYVLKSDLILDDSEILDDDLIKFDVVSDDGRIGKITDIFYASETNKILRVLFDKEVLIPFNSPMIKEINKEKEQVIVSLIEGM